MKTLRHLYVYLLLATNLTFFLMAASAESSTTLSSASSSSVATTTAIEIAAFGVPPKKHQIDRRRAITSISTTFPILTTLSPPPAFSSEEAKQEAKEEAVKSTAAAAASEKRAFEKRNRNSNKNAIIREDFWYMFNRVPPRNLDPKVLPRDDPKWNTWGTCEAGSDSSSNSCTYVPLKLRSAGYSKYAFLISLASRDYEALGNILLEQQRGKKDEGGSAWEKQALSYLDEGGAGRVPSPILDAVRKMVLLATSLLTSPNYSGPPRDLLVARYYVNEVAFAASEMRSAIEAGDGERARDAWEYGKDSWNSYYVVVNRAIVPKVGDKFEFLV